MIKRINRKKFMDYLEKNRLCGIAICIFFAVIFIALGYCICDFINKIEPDIEGNLGSSLYLKDKGGEPEFITFVAPDNYLLPIALTTPTTGKMNAILTSYQAVSWQCDSTPCISASGMNVCETDKNIAANNCLDFGTKIERANGEIYEIQDRMNERYGCSYIDLLTDERIYKREVITVY